jgi:hypothetical protein
MRYNFVIIVEPEFYHNDLGEELKERLCNKLARTIEELRGVKCATVDWEGTIGEQNESE